MTSHKSTCAGFAFTSLGRRAPRPALKTARFFARASEFARLAITSAALAAGFLALPWALAIAANAI
jgi:hypothetical protein